jgi:hypothetical protein
MEPIITVDIKPRVKKCVIAKVSLDNLCKKASGLVKKIKIPEIIPKIGAVKKNLLIDSNGGA